MSVTVLTGYKSGASIVGHWAKNAAQMNFRNLSQENPAGPAKH